MTYRPQPSHRRNIREVILPLTAAIYRVFGSRAQDGGRPIGAFYTVNVDSRVWRYLGGIWYRPLDEEAIRGIHLGPFRVDIGCQALVG